MGIISFRNRRLHRIREALAEAHPWELDDLRFVLEAVDQYRRDFEKILDVVEGQAKDEALWSVPAEGKQPIGEAYLQQELRHLHRVIEEVSWSAA